MLFKYGCSIFEESTLKFSSCILLFLFPFPLFPSTRLVHTYHLLGGLRGYGGKWSRPQSGGPGSLMLEPVSFLLGEGSEDKYIQLFTV